MDEQALPTSMVAALNEIGIGKFPGYVGMRIVDAVSGLVRGELDLQSYHRAPNGYLHAAVVVTLADTACGYGVRTCMPEGAKGFTTIELKSNFLATVLAGTIGVEARLAHGGKRTQVWDATVREGVAVPDADGKVLALFRCTQMILY